MIREFFKKIGFSKPLLNFIEVIGNKTNVEYKTNFINLF